MNNKRIFRKYYSKLALEGIIKALILGVIVGLFISLIPATVVLIANLSYNWIPISVGVGIVVTVSVGIVVAAISTISFYFVLYRPKVRQIAARVDRLGLDERLITMMELENDPSYIAMIQREDAKEKLALSNHKKLRLSIFKIPLILLLIVSLGSAAMLTGASSAFQEMLPWQSIPCSERPLPPSDEFDYHLVIYRAGHGGVIEINAVQFVITGQNTLAVIAIPMHGYAFLEWSDGVRSATRIDRNVREDFYVDAIFVQVRDGDGDDDSGPPSNRPGPGDDDEGSMRFRERNMVIDGEIWYGDVLEDFRDKGLENAESLDSALRRVLQRFFRVLT